MNELYIIEPEISKIATSLSDELLPETIRYAKNLLTLAILKQNLGMPLMSNYGDDLKWREWVEKSKKNAIFVLTLIKECHKEQQYRGLNSEIDIKQIENAMKVFKFEQNKGTEFVLTIPQYWQVKSEKTGKPLIIKSYRKYFSEACGWREYTWTRRQPPRWLLQDYPILDCEVIEKEVEKYHASA